MGKRPDAHQVLETLLEKGGLKPGLAAEVSRETGVPEATIYGAGSFFHLLSDPDTRVRICTGLSCQMTGAAKVLEAAEAAGLPCTGTQCLAACDQPVAVLRDRRVLPQVTVEDMARTKGDPNKLHSRQAPEDTWRGRVGPEDGDPETLAIHLLGAEDHSGEAFRAAESMGAEALFDQLEASGLQGRGGAGFPAHIKWRGVASQLETTRYVVLNADEGEPGTFKDRDVMMYRPDKVLEGLAISARAVGATDIYLYLRGEFELPWHRLEAAIERFEAAGTFGDLRFHLHAGHGAYICGEETALLEALEGKRGMPRLKPPFPTEHGLWGKPTLVHNVETIACVPAIVLRGGAWFRAQGRTEPGSKLYCISGDVARPGTYELPLGVSLDELVDAAGGHVGTLKAFSPGGASSGFLPPRERGRPLDFKTLGEVGAMLGSAGVVVLNDTRSILDAVRNQLQFFEAESCGQCAPCRIGTRFLRERLDAHLESGRQQGEANPLAQVKDVAWEMAEGSICGLGQIAALPLTSAMRWFPEDFETSGGG